MTEVLSGEEGRREEGVKRRSVWLRKSLFGFYDTHTDCRTSK
jgi:hypothetical protein